MKRRDKVGLADAERDRVLHLRHNRKEIADTGFGERSDVLRNEAGGVIHGSEAQGLTEGWSRRVPSSVTTKPSFL